MQTAAYLAQRLLPKASTIVPILHSGIYWMLGFLDPSILAWGLVYVTQIRQGDYAWRSHYSLASSIKKSRVRIWWSTRWFWLPLRRALWPATRRWPGTSPLGWLLSRRKSTVT